MIVERSFFAKSMPLQTIEEHTRLALQLYMQLRTVYPYILTEAEWEILRDAIIHHDLGKIDVKFENKIRKVLKMTALEDRYAHIDEIPHNVLSCALVDRAVMKKKHSPLGYEILLKSIYYHHDRKTDFTKQEVGEYAQATLTQSENIFTWNLSSLPQKVTVDFFTYINFEQGDADYTDMLHSYILVKGLLNRIDYAASAGIENIEESCLHDGMGLADYVHKLFRDKNRVPRPVQQYMQDHQDENLVVVAATGIGKTEASLLWIGNHKGFYTLPLKVSINAIFKRVKEEIGFENVALLHSDALSYQLHELDHKETIAEQRNIAFSHVFSQYTCAKLLAKPLTISTIDQLFKFVFRYNGGEVAQSALSYSRLVIDEIQMYSKELVAIILVAIKQITEVGGKFAIVTATFPPVLLNFMKKLDIPLAPVVKPFHAAITKRHKIKLLREQDFDYDTIRERGKYQKVLIITNTVKRAQQIYRRLHGGQDISVKLLHSYFMKKDRTRLEAEILHFACNDVDKRQAGAGIWISTQIVEASLDIDFDVLFTELCSVDSLLQRLGRIYRSREYDLKGEPNVFILDNKNGYGKVIDKEIYDFSAQAVRKFDGQLLEESDEQDLKQDMINMVYDPQINPAILKSEYYRYIEGGIFSLMNLPMYKLDRQEVQSMFRAIESITIIPLGMYQQLEKTGQIVMWQNELEENRTNHVKQQLIKDEILQYTINLPHYHDQLCWIQRKGFLYDKFKIALYDGEYDFDTTQSAGLGLVKRQHDKQPQYAQAEFL